MNRLHVTTRSLLSVLALLAVFVLAACGSSSSSGGSGSSSGSGSSGGSGAAKGSAIAKDPSAAGKSFTIGSKNFTESIIVAEIYGQAAEAAGYTVKRDLNLGLEQVATKAMKSGQIDGYPEYTGTALSAVLGVPIKKVPRDPDQAYAQTKKLYASKLNFVAFARTPFQDANTVGILPATAKKFGNPTKISDLKPVAGKMRIAASAECFQRTDCGLGLKQIYGLSFKQQIPIDVALRHEIVEKGRADLTIPFTTDGQIAQNHMIILKDDKKLFPPYNVTFVLTSAAAKRLGPKFEALMGQVQTGLTTPVMTELNSRVDIDKQKPADVAREFLKAQGFIK